MAAARLLRLAALDPQCAATRTHPYSPVRARPCSPVRARPLLASPRCRGWLRSRRSVPRGWPGLAEMERAEGSGACGGGGGAEAARSRS
jgi:hypothetical protein